MRDDDARPDGSGGDTDAPARGRDGERDGGRPDEGRREGGDPRRTLAGLLDLAWSRLEAGVSDPGAAARNLTLATVADGAPRARTLVIRGASREAAWVEAHTDGASHKVAELRAEPRAAVHVWDADHALQVRLRARAEVLCGDAVAEAWARVPEAGRWNYGGHPAPARPIASPEAYEPGAERARFAVLRLRVEALEALLLEEPHLRALYEHGDGFAGRWIAP